MSTVICYSRTGNVHLLHDGFEALTLGGGGEGYYGATLRNLLSLAMLDEIRAAVGLA